MDWEDIRLAESYEQFYVSRNAISLSGPRDSTHTMPPFHTIHWHCSTASTESLNWDTASRSSDWKWRDAYIETFAYCVARRPIKGECLYSHLPLPIPTFTSDLAHHWYASHGSRLIRECGTSCKKFPIPILMHYVWDNGLDPDFTAAGRSISSGISLRRCS